MKTSGKSAKVSSLYPARDMDLMHQKVFNNNKIRQKDWTGELAW